MIPGVLVTLVLETGGASAEPPADREPGTHVAFVGELVSLQEMNPCDPDKPLLPGQTFQEVVKSHPPTWEGDAMVMCGFNHIFEARYRVIEAMAGELPESELTFRLADHYGTPSFVEQPHALLVVTLGDGEPYLQKYQGIDVDPLRSGGWAVCGSLRDHAYVAAPPSEQLAFDGPESSFDVGDFEAAALEKLRMDPDFEVVGTTAHCRRGVPVAKVLRFLQDGVLKARGVVLEPAPAKP